MLLRAQSKWEVKALLVVLLLHLLQAWFWFGKFPFYIPWEIQGALMLPMAIQLMPVMVIYLVPWVAVPVALLLLGGLGYLAFAVAKPGWLRTWLCGLFYYLLLLLIWPVFTGVGCTTCQS